jgi:biopolymer transport protein ExbD
MRIPAQTRSKDTFSNAMTPMIDVVFLLLVFFVCAAAKQVREALLPADLPAGAVAASETLPEKPILGEAWVYLRRGATGLTVAELNGTPYEDLGQLEQQLRGLAELAPEMPVILDIADDVEFGDLIRVYDVCRAAKFQSVNFAVADRAPPAKPKRE